MGQKRFIRSGPSNGRAHVFIVHDYIYRTSLFSVANIFITYDITIPGSGRRPDAPVSGGSYARINIRRNTVGSSGPIEAAAAAAASRDRPLCAVTGAFGGLRGTFRPTVVPRTKTARRDRNAPVRGYQGGRSCGFTSVN